MGDYIGIAMADIEKGNRPHDVLELHFKYLAKHRIREAVELAQRLLRDDDRKDRHYYEAFAYIKSMPDAQQLLEDILPELKGQTFWIVLEDLVETRSEAAMRVLEERFAAEGTDADLRPRIANLLARYGHIEAFHYYADYIKRTGDTPHDGHAGCFGHLADARLIPSLVDLLRHSHAEEWKDEDEFSTLERTVLTGLRSVALQSDANLSAVTAAIDEVIKHSPRHAYLHTYPELWQDEFVRQNTCPRKIAEVTAILDQIESCRL